VARDLLEIVVLAVMVCVLMGLGYLAQLGAESRDQVRCTCMEADRERR